MMEIEKDIQPNQKIWVCEFCQAINIVNIEPEEVPKESEAIYMLKSANQEQLEKNTAPPVNKYPYLKLPFPYEYGRTPCTPFLPDNMTERFSNYEASRKKLPGYLPFSCPNFPNLQKTYHKLLRSR